MFSVCAVIYGDHLPLAEKLLKSLETNYHVKDFRIGLNGVSAATREFVHSWAARQSRSQPVFIFEEVNQFNVGKYPLMRHLIRYDNPADLIMWFDDDSCVDPQAGADWWEAAHRAAQASIQIGAIHVIAQRNRQHEVIKAQPWYRKKPINRRSRYTFATGGWWVAQTHFLHKWDYPFPALHHNGGDSILGELLRQQGHKPRSFSRLQCHCESCLKRAGDFIFGRPVVHINIGGRSGRRGLGKGRSEYYVWSDGNPTPAIDHQTFEMKVYRYEL